MAEDSLGRHLARQVAALDYGDLSPVESSEFDGKFTEDSSFLKTAKDTIVKSKQANIFDSLGSRIPAAVLYAWKENSTFMDAPKPTVYVIARIPEIDMCDPPSSLPVDNDPNDPEADWHAIDMHTTFVGRDEGLLVPKPTDIVYVDFGNRKQFRDPVYLGLASSTLLAHNPSHLVATDAALPLRRSIKHINKKMKKATDRRLFFPAPSDVDKIFPEPKLAPPLDLNKAPVIGCYVAADWIWKGKYQKGAVKAGRPLPFFWAEDWIKKVVDSGINYLSFKLHGRTAARDGSVISDDYTKKLSGRSVREEIKHILKVARAKKLDFEIHGWGDSGAQAFGTGKKVYNLTQKPQNKQEAIAMAVTEARAVAKKLKFLGLTNYHWSAEHDAFQDWPGWIGSEENPRPGRRSTDAARAMNDITAKVFSNELRKQVPGVRIWFNGFIECISPVVLLDYFDVIEPKIEVASPDNITKKFDGKHYGAPDGVLLLPNYMPISWTIPAGDWTSAPPEPGHEHNTWKTIKKKLLEYKSQIYGMNIFILTSQLHQSYNNYPSFKEQVRQLREGYNNTF
tara:strand:- start:2461 stop:4155 length:1695 start_codon:yes stop_codon:yes gene_type:complete